MDLDIIAFTPLSLIQDGIIPHGVWIIFMVDLDMAVMDMVDTITLIMVMVAMVVIIAVANPVEIIKMQTIVCETE